MPDFSALGELRQGMEHNGTEKGKGKALQGFFVHAHHALAVSSLLQDPSGTSESVRTPM